eukprot:gene13300-9138_t
MESFQIKITFFGQHEHHEILSLNYFLLFSFLLLKSYSSLFLLHIFTSVRSMSKVSRFYPLDTKKEQKIDEILQLIKAEYPTPPPQLALAIRETKDPQSPTPHNPTRLYAAAFLKSRKWDVAKAFEMAKDVIQFRKDCNADTRSLFPAPISLRGWSQEDLREYFEMDVREKSKLDAAATAVDRSMQCGVHYWDHHGIPVFYLMVGRVDEAGILKRLKRVAEVGQSPADAMWPYLEQYMLVFEALARYQQAQIDTGSLTEGIEQCDGIVRAVTIVMDATGLNYKMLWKPAVDLLTSSLKKMFQVFPDSVYRILVVNSPAVVRVAYSLVKPVLDENLQSKVRIYGPHETAEALQKIIDKKFIPSFLGGDCTCEGHCIQTFDPNAKKRSGEGKEDSDVDEDATKNIKVSAGHKEAEVLQVEANETVSWDFAGDEVEFCIFFLPSLANTSVQSNALSKTKHKNFMVQHSICKASTDQFTAPMEGTLVLQFDNSRSWVSAVRIQCKVVKILGNDCATAGPAAESNQRPDFSVERGVAPQSPEKQQKWRWGGGLGASSTVLTSMNALVCRFSIFKTWLSKGLRSQLLLWCLVVVVVFILFLFMFTVSFFASFDAHEWIPQRCLLGLPELPFAVGPGSAAALRSDEERSMFHVFDIRCQAVNGRRGKKKTRAISTSLFSIQKDDAYKEFV